MNKKIPVFKSDKELEEFLEGDLSDYIHAGNFRRVKFELMPKAEKVNLRISAKLLEAIKAKAKKLSMPYQQYIRLVMEKEVLDPKA